MCNTDSLLSFIGTSFSSERYQINIKILQLLTLNLSVYLFYSVVLGMYDNNCFIYILLYVWF